MYLLSLDPATSRRVTRWGRRVTRWGREGDDGGVAEVTVVGNYGSQA